MPGLLESPMSGLDPSWRIGLNMAMMKNFQFGQDIVYNFGPLGYLFQPTYVDFILWAISSSFTVIIHFLFLSTMAMLALKSSATWKQYVLLVPAALLLAMGFSCIEYKLLLTAMILFYLIMTDQVGRMYGICLLVVSSLILLAIASLLKFNATLISASMIIIAMAVFIYKRQLLPSVSLLLTYSGALFTLWLLTGQELSGLPVYLARSYEISSGYNAAMAIKGPVWHLYVGLAAIGIIAFTSIISIRRKKYYLPLLTLLGSGYIFMSFKHGFIRHDAHVYIFFTNIFLLLCVMLISNKKEIDAGMRYLILLISLIIFVVISQQYPEVMKPNIAGKISMIESSLSLWKDDSYRRLFAEESKKNIRVSHHLREQSVLYLQDKSVDIIPWDISLAYAYALNWAPRPVFQSHSAYTKNLDLLNARHFQSEDAPASVIYSYKSIDWRYPIFDEPATFREILCRYHAIQQDGEFIILQKNKDSVCGEKEILSSSVAHIGNPIEIPRHFGGHLFAKITMRYSWIGKVVGLFYKPSHAHIRFIGADGTMSPRYRFIPDVAKNGIFLSQKIDGLNNLFSVFSGNRDIDSNIRKIIIEVDKNWHYEKEIEVEIFSIPAASKDIYTFSYHLQRSQIITEKGGYVKVAKTEFTINNDKREVLFEHPNSEVIFKDVPINENAELSFGIGINQPAWDKSGDGVLFEITVVDKKSQKNVFFTKYIDPKNKEEDRKWFDINLSLKAFAGQKVSFIFKTTGGPKEDLNYDWAGWSSPQIILIGNKKKAANN